jgi:hypothetical protein
MMSGLVKFMRQLLYLPEYPQDQVKHEMLIRPQSFRLQYQKWVKQGRQSELLKNLYTSFTLGKLGIAGEVPLHYFQDEQRKHLVIHYIENMGRELFPFLHDYFKDRILKLGYQVFLSDRKVVERLGYIEKTEQHVLKPIVSSYPSGSRQEQIYGVVVLQIRYIDERPLYLELITEEIIDRNYASAFTFDELMEILFV